MYELLIENGTVVDGTGAAGFRADVGIAGGRIVAVGALGGEPSRRKIDAEGHVVTPGFVDVHTHMDAQIAWDGLGESSVWHGVTTAVMGNCGFTLAPVRSDARELVVRNLERAEDIAPEAMAAGIDWQWETFREYLDFVDRTPKGINYAGYLGHSALRTWAMGERAFTDEAGPDDLALMVAQVQDALRAGALGLTTSISPNHETSDDRPVASRVASWSEIATLVGAMGAMGAGIFELANHGDLRGPDPAKREAYIARMADLARTTGIPITYGALAFGDEDHEWRPIVEMCDRINGSGGTSWAQVHSRQFGVLWSFATRLPFDRLPEWADLRRRPLPEQAAVLRDPDRRDRLVAAAERGDYGRAIGAETRAPEWDQVFLLDRPLPPFRPISAIAADRGVSPMRAFVDLALEAELEGFFMQAVFNRNQDKVLELLCHPQAIPTFSDSGAHVTQIMDSSLPTHLLGHWVRNVGAFTLEDAVRRLTWLPARAWGFDDRGRVHEGCTADLNVFDPATVAPNMPELVHDLPAGAARLRQTATGFLATVVGGEVLVDDGAPTDARPGRLIRGPLAS